MKSNSLFDNNTSSKVQHAERTYEEQAAARGKLMMKICIPAALVIAAAIFGIVKYNDIQLQRKRQEIQQVRQEQETESRKIEQTMSAGYEDAMMKLEFIEAPIDEFSQFLVDLVISAADAKPSTIYSEVWDAKKLPDNDPLKNNVQFTQSYIRVTCRIPGKEWQKQIIWQEKEYPVSQLQSIINEWYAEIYPDRPPVFSADNIQELKAKEAKELKDKNTPGLVRDRYHILPASEDGAEDKYNIQLAIPKMEN